MKVELVVSMYEIESSVFAGMGARERKVRVGPENKTAALGVQE